MDTPHSDLEALRKTLAELTARVRGSRNFAAWADPSDILRSRR